MAISADDIKMNLDGQQSNETTPEEASVNPEWATCRLRNVLNEDCLLKVMEFLNVYDLIQMCYTDSYFKDLITKWIVGKKLLNLRGMTQVCKDEIFEMFGKSMRKFIIYESDFKNFLETIIKYCAPDRLTEIELNLKQPMIDNFENINLSMPFFSQVRKFKLNVLRFQRFSTFNDFLTALVTAAPKLRHLQLFHVDIEGTWLKTNSLLNLTELRILKPCVVSIPDLKYFLRSVPNLQRFTYKGEEDITTIGSTLIECCPNLDTFKDIHTANAHRRFGLGINRYNFLASFPNLSNITLTSYTFCGCDLYQPLVKLATTNVVQIKIFSNLDHAVAFDETDRHRIMQSCSFGNFHSLQILELDVRNYRLAGDFCSEFILHFATQLKNLERFTLRSSRLANANRIIELLPQIRTISISQITFKHLPVEMRKIVRTLRTMRQASDKEDGSDVLQLIVNIEQWRELQVYKDIDKLANTVVDPFVEPYNHFHRCPSEIET